ncbi:MAG: extracellular solute-binding protein [Planctomycetota bacterium]
MQAPHSPLRAALARPLALLGALLTLAACGQEPDLVVRISLDQVFSEALIDEFEADTGLTVKAYFDIEQTKTVGHVRAIQEEARSNPRTDVFWNNEIAQTVRLAEEGLLEPYDSPSAEGIPEMFRDPERRWTGFAARARCLIVNTDVVPEGEGPLGTLDLLSPDWSGQCGIARPLTGTTLTHATALYQVMGEDWARNFFGQVVALNGEGKVNVAESNGQTMRQVGEGEYAWAWTDTDDFNVAKRNKEKPVRRVFPDQEPGDGVLMKNGEPIGTLLIPNTVMLLKDAPHPDNAKRFIDWVLSKEIEKRLAYADSAQIPVREDVQRPGYVGLLGDFKAMEVDYVELGKTIAARTDELGDLFLR